ncbi:hypothetical protein RchiOBHm_Chr1g0316851 [Rosa chinensis]|uniref:Uncharacterized protein n=1 Tax=Rosa chinensis TaxID=74649 RepID=A0A2P6S7V1_ROSCH|nr:hypothetical protein RchiOBHm_Chr1g0316851 [Rosa chinensis]
MRISNRIGTCKSLRAFLIAADLQSVNRRDEFCSRISAKTGNALRNVRKLLHH